jgi:DNA-binding NtrC family response regulator
VGPALAPDALEALRGYRWPGNIRELQNAIERALILSDGSVVSEAHLGLGGGAGAWSNGPGDRNSAAPPAPELLADLEKRAILAALEQTLGNKTHAAARLGITRTQLHTRLKRFGIA